MFLPDHETDVDLICYQPIAKTVVELLKSHPKKPLTIGIHGNWGAGKSSVLKMIQTELSGDKDVACLWFNGWTFQGFDDAKIVLIESIIDELQRNRTLSKKAQETAATLLKRVNWLKMAKTGLKYAVPGLMMLAAGTGHFSPELMSLWFLQYTQQAKTDLLNLKPDDVQKIMDKAPDFLKDGEQKQVSEQVHLIRQEFQALLKEAKIKQLVVLIDDLDRCLPETAISTLEAIRLFLFVPGTAFVIGADEAMIEYSVGRHFPGLPLSSGPTTYTRNYLEKLIQVPFRLPSLGIEETKIYVLLLLVQALVGEDSPGFKTLLAKGFEALKKPWIKTDLTQDDVQAVDPNKQDALNALRLLSNQISPILAEGTKGNPRQIKRFLNSMVLRHAVAKARGFGEEIKQSALAKLMLAERFHPDLYDHLVSEVTSSSDGKALLLNKLEGARNTEVTESETPEANTEPPEEPEENNKWIEQEWVKNWAKIDPKLGALDLRPYIFVSQDKRIRFEAAQGNEELVQLVGVLRSSGVIAIRNETTRIKALSAADSETAFKMLQELVGRSDNFQNKPEGIDGMIILAQYHQHLRPLLIQFIQSLPVNSVGIWAVRGWAQALSDEPFRGQLNTIFTGWHTQLPSGQMKTALEGVLSSAKGGT